MSHAGWQHKKGSLISLCLWPEQNNKLWFRNTKLYLIIRQIQDKKKLYSDKKGVSCVKVRVVNLINLKTN